VAKGSPLLSRIREGSGSNLGPDTGYPHWGICGSLQSLPANTRIVPSIMPRTFPSITFQIDKSSYHSTLYSLSYWQRRSIKRKHIHYFNLCRTPLVVKIYWSFIFWIEDIYLCFGIRVINLHWIKDDTWFVRTVCSLQRLNLLKLYISRRTFNVSLVLNTRISSVIYFTLPNSSKAW
jgi:hypothetical protein